MKAFAYSNGCRPNESEPIELNEIFLFANAKILKEIARQLISAAKEKNHSKKTFDQILSIKSFAYPIGDPLQKNKPLELNYITLSAGSKTIGLVAQHLIRAAGQMEKLGDSFDHFHMQGNSPGWVDHWPDIIVCKPHDEKT